MSLALIAVALVGTPGCGGSGAESEEGGEADSELSEEQREEAEREQAAEQIAESDRIAYYQLATSSGLLRAFAASARSGASPAPRAEQAELEAAVGRVAKLDPEDGELGRLAERLEDALRVALRADFDSPGELIATTDAINAGLERFVKRNPAATILVPD